MSLLLEALKKAELAKQAAKESPPATQEPPFTRDRLPDISQPMEIHSDDMRLAEPEPVAKRVERTVLELAPEDPPLREPAPRTGPATRASAVESGYALPGDPSYSPAGETVERQQAQQLFAAKELDVNPRRPFYITLAGLGLFALGTVGYFWYQLQPRSAFRPPPPSAQSAPPPVAVAPVTAAALPDPQASATATAAVGTSPAGMTPPAQPAAPAAMQPPRPAARPNAVFRRQDASPESVPDAEAPKTGGTRRESGIAITPARVQSDPIVEGAFEAFNAGDLARARSDYQQVLRYSPNSRDALLGLAAVETQARRHDAAESYYLRLLDLDPRDALAQAGLISLRGQADPLAAESRLKSMIASQPGVSFLHFALGNQYAAQERWAEAQQSYFQAYTSEPEHPDFAYNLAVSLDRIHQSKPALEYYRRALTLGADRPVSFDKAQVSKRIAQLEP
jgi:tetratricopeptide (TPR) repeat protein